MSSDDHKDLRSNPQAWADPVLPNAEYWKEHHDKRQKLAASILGSTFGPTIMPGVSTGPVDELKGPVSPNLFGPGGLYPPSVSIPPTEPKIAYKYAEDKILLDLEVYLDSTYAEHYMSEDQEHMDNLQCFDAWIALGDATPTFRNTALKYLWRYGKKNGSNKADLMKALHYVILALYNDHYKGK